MISNTPHTHTCAFCDGLKLSLVMDFGEVALAGSFLKKEQIIAEQKFPLKVCFCNDCYAVQVVNKVPPDILFKDYFYFSSSIGTLCEHFSNYATEVTRRFLKSAQATVLEIGCNDGVLLRPLADQGIRNLFGFDPAENIVATVHDPRINIINNYFTGKAARNFVEKHGKADLILANNVYAHILDIQGATRAIEYALTADGVFIFEVHYLGKVISEIQYDMIYHEHLYYYSLLSAINHFKRYGMVVFDVKPVSIHGGSMRFYVCKKESKYSTQSEAVKLLEADERAKGLDKKETFQKFSSNVAETRAALMGLLREIKAKGKSIVGYGASGRANTIIQYCKISNKELDYIVDDAPAKKGFFTPGSHFKIYPRNILEKKNAPDYVLVFAWGFFEEIRKRNLNYLAKGGRMILPLPQVSIFQAPFDKIHAAVIIK